MSIQRNHSEYRYIEECAERRHSLSEESHTSESESVIEYLTEDDSEADLYLLHTDSSGSDPDGEAWNQSSTNIVRTLATFWSFALMGANDAAEGVSLAIQMLNMNHQLTIMFVGINAICTEPCLPYRLHVDLTMYTARDMVWPLIHDGFVHIPISPGGFCYRSLPQQSHTSPPGPAGPRVYCR